MKNVLFLLLGWWLVSCNSGVEIERLAPKDLVAVSSFISPQDSIVRVYVYQGKALGDIANSDKAVIKDAKVSISDGSTTQNLLFDEKTRSYAISNQVLKVTASKRYALEVNTATGTVLKATCQIPPNPAEVQIDGVRDANDFIFSYAWPPLEKIAYFTYNFELTDVLFRPRLGATSGPSISLIFSADNNLFDNNDRPNKAIERKVFNAFLAEKVSLKTVFQSIDKNTFQYLKTKTDANSWNANSSGFIPNLREPQPVFSNVIGGVGVFGGYNQRISITKIL